MFCYRTMNDVSHGTIYIVTQFLDEGLSTTHIQLTVSFYDVNTAQ